MKPIEDLPPALDERIRDAFARALPCTPPKDAASPNASVVATGVRGDPTIPVWLRTSLGALLCRAVHVERDVVAVHIDDLADLAEKMGVDFEIHDGRIIPLPLHVDDAGRELTEDELDG